MKLSVIIAIAISCITSFQSKVSSQKERSLLLTQDMFEGIWKYQNGNEIFIVNLWRTSDGYKGHYKKIISDGNGNQISEVYNSNKPVGNTTTNWPHVINTDNASLEHNIRGIVIDNSINNLPNSGSFIDGYIDMKILNPNCFGHPSDNCILQAQWTVKKRPGLQNPSEPNFNIPTNIVLTKQ